MRAELKQFEEKMNKAITFFTNDINTIRAGRANPAVLDKVQVEYYGVPSPLNQVGTVSVPEPTMIVIQPWDATLLPEIEKAIIEADATLPEEIRNGKKWQMIYLRAVIDGELYRNDFKRNEKVLEYFNKIIELCHLETALFIVKPDIIEDDKYGRVLSPKELRIIAAGGTLD